MKNAANIITASRIFFSVILIITIPFSIPFWILYAGCGVSDILDGFIARLLKQESSFGAKLDSIADFIFALSLCIIVMRYITIPFWLWCCILMIALLRFFGYGIGYYKFRTIVTIHTYGNKLTGILLFASPLIFYLCGLTVTGILLSVVAFLSAVDEVAVIVKSKELNRDCKGFFFFS